MVSAGRRLRPFPRCRDGKTASVFGFSALRLLGGAHPFERRRAAGVDTYARFVAAAPQAEGVSVQSGPGADASRLRGARGCVFRQDGAYFRIRDFVRACFLVAARRRRAACASVDIDPQSLFLAGGG